MPKLVAKNIFLLIMSLLFYGYGEPKFLYIMLLSVLINWLIGLAINQFRTRTILPKALLAFMVVYNIGILFVYKYLNSIISNVNSIFDTDWPHPTLFLPIGISFFTFQAMSYVIDVYRGVAPVQKNFFNTALYICLFPPLIAGPIVRYTSIMDQLTDRKFRFDDFSCGIKRFIIGLSKKLIIANLIAVVVDQAYSASDVGSLSILMAWFGAFAYLIQLYFDFSGYSDMAIGLSRMFGFKLNENFNYPYISKSIVEYWSRWHISLSTWFRDYLYFPVFRTLQSRKNPLTGKRFSIRTCDFTALFVVWICCGTWHGAGIKYPLFGLYWFVFIVIERLVEEHLKKRRKQLKLQKKKSSAGIRALQHVYTIFVVLIGQVIFRANGLREAVRYLLVMFGVSGSATAVFDEKTLFLIQDNWVLLIIAVIACCPVLKVLEKRFTGNAAIALELVGNLLLMILFLVCVSYTVNNSYNPFIYFNF
ncbi:MAG: MBOAT family protein [Clostridiales Family XIII bacterium]|nr:MBOAT family protein [Clostridiales Family XIII bacterium]